MHTVALALVFVTLVACNKRSERTPEGPFLVFEERASAVEDEQKRDTWLTAGAYVWQTMSDARREALQENLSEVRDGLETLGNPFAIDLGDETPEQNLKSLRKRWMAHLTAARALTMNRWTTLGGSTVRVARTCPKPSGCVSLWPTAQQATPNPGARQVRFAAAHVSASATIASADTRKARDALMRASEDPSSTIALVVSGSAPPHAEMSEFSELVQEVATLMERKKKDKPWSTTFASVPEHVPHPTWMELSKDELWVIPKMHDIARLQAFEEEIATVLKGARVHWRFERRPRL